MCVNYEGSLNTKKTNKSTDSNDTTSAAARTSSFKT